MLLTAALGSNALLYAAPAVFPESERVSSLHDAFRVSAAVSAAFLVANGVAAVLDALLPLWWVVWLCAAAVAYFASFLACRVTDCGRVLFMPTIVMALLIIQPDGSTVERCGYAIGTVLGYTLIVTAMSAVLERIRLSDAPGRLKGLPLLLCVLGLSSLAFGGF